MSEPESRPTATDWPFLLTGALLIGVALVLNEWVLGAWLTVGGRVTNPGSRLVLALVDLTAIAAGLTLVLKRRRAPWRQMLMSLAATLFALALAEGGLRLVFSLQSWAQPVDRQIDDTLGWRPVANLTLEREMPGFGRVRYSTTRGGFRVFGDPSSTKTKVLVLGDSFTEAATVSDGETYYERLGRLGADLEIFAIGGGGYGTLQEYLLLDQWADTIRPNLVIVQMHPNDLINNSHALESKSTTDNNQMTRPYWEAGRVVSRFPENASWGPLYNLARHSYLLRLVNVNVVFLRSKRPGSVEQAASPDDPDVVDAKKTTAELLALMERRAGVPVAVFSVLPDGWFGFWSVSDVARMAGVRYIPGVGEAVETAGAEGERVTGQPVDAHWNGRGHEIAAGVIARWLQEASWRTASPAPLPSSATPPAPHTPPPAAPTDR
jgi:hypothetical protein